MVQKLRERSGGQGGFTLVELLVVMLILGLLAAIAIPSFFNQRDKARDADAKAEARTAQTAMETYATDNGGRYVSPAPANATPAAQELADIESSLQEAVDETRLTVASTPTTYTVTVEGTSDAGNLFSIAKDADGIVTLTCEDSGGNPGEDGCPASGNWGE
jgi:type IV pilus assembly protein PilA